MGQLRVMSPHLAPICRSLGAGFTSVHGGKSDVVAAARRREVLTRLRPRRPLTRGRGDSYESVESPPIAQGPGMKFALLTQAPVAIQVHLATVLPAFAIGTWQIFFSVKGSPVHRALGYAYLALMTVTAIAAFFIRSVGHGSLTAIHLSSH